MASKNKTYTLTVVGSSLEESLEKFQAGLPDDEEVSSITPLGNKLIILTRPIESARKGKNLLVEDVQARNGKKT